jgi:hypothetical protein
VSVPIGLTFAYKDTPQWESIFLRGENINGPLSDLPVADQIFLDNFDVKTIGIIPLFLNDHFWGLFCIIDCKNERYFSNDEINSLHSMSLMMANAVNRNAQIIKIRETHERTKLLLGSVPFACHIWSNDYKLMDCNEENLRLFNLKNKQEFIDNWSNFLPERQPNGQLSAELTRIGIREAFLNGRYVVNDCMHQMLDGTPIPAEVTLVRVPFEDGHAVAAYLRDLREHKQMMNEIEQRDDLLQTVNKVAAVLLHSETKDFENDLRLCMDMIGKTVHINRVCVWKNSVKDERLYCTQIYEWVENVDAQINSDITIDVPYEAVPLWEEVLSRGDCINAIVRNLPGTDRARLTQHGILSVFAADRKSVV